MIMAGGAGQEHLAADPTGTDASGNARSGGIRQRITDDFAAHRQELNLKLLDPRCGPPSQRGPGVREPDAVRGLTRPSARF
jgi:hypothetical protein